MEFLLHPPSLFLARSNIARTCIMTNRSLSWHHSLSRRKITSLRRTKQPVYVNSGSGVYSQRDKRPHSFNVNIADGNLLRQECTWLARMCKFTEQTTLHACPRYWWNNFTFVALISSGLGSAQTSPANLSSITDSPRMLIGKSACVRPFDREKFVRAWNAFSEVCSIRTHDVCHTDERGE